MPGWAVPAPSTLTIWVVPWVRSDGFRSRTYTLFGPPLEGSGVAGSRLVAMDWNATTEPSAFSDGKSLSPSAASPEVEALTRIAGPGLAGSVMSRM